MAKSFDLETSPSHLLRRANQYANDLYTNEQDAKVLTQRQFAVLFAIDQREGMSQTELVEATGIDRSTLADMIVRMQKKDYLARRRTEEDQRANSVRITAAGRRALKTALPAVTKSEARLLDALPARSRGEFIKCLILLAKADAAALAAQEASGKSKGRRRR
jgi:DNA-binding MarR family transcriptional regulator